MIIKNITLKTYSPFKKSIVEIFDMYTGRTICFIRCIPFFWFIRLYMKIVYKASLKDNWDYEIISHSEY